MERIKTMTSEAIYAAIWPHKYTTQLFTENSSRLLNYPKAKVREFYLTPCFVSVHFGLSAALSKEAIFRPALPPSLKQALG